MDDFLEVNLEDPLVLFECDASQANSDSLVLIGIKNPNVFSELQSIPMRFYLENDNDALSIIHDSGKKVARFLPFARIDAETAVQFDKDFPELKELVVFGLYLEGITIDENELDSYNALKDGTYRNMSMRNTEMINDREIMFVSRDVGEKQSGSYKKLVANTFTLKR